MRLTPRILLPAAKFATHVSWVLLALLLAGAGDAHAQESLRRRMDALTRSLANDVVADPRTFFPTRGDWTWIHTAHERGGNRVGIFRFPAAETERAIGDFCPLRSSFTFQPEGQPVGGLIGVALEHPSGWRRVRGTRFVPPGARASSPVFVEWRREDGRWVISSFGDEAQSARELPDDLPNTIRPDTAGATAFPTGQRWYEEHVPIHFQGRRYQADGPPRQLPAELLAPVGSLGEVRIYKVARERDPEVLYVPAGPGSVFIPYQTYQYLPCNR